MSNIEGQQQQATTTTTSKRSCGFISFLPLGMSCRGRAEAFARRLQFRLRSLNSQVRIQSTLLYILAHCELKIIFFRHQDQNPSPTDADADTPEATASDREADGVTIPLKLPGPDASAASSSHNQHPPSNGVHQYAAISVSDGFDDVDLNGSGARPIPPPRHHQTNSSSYIIASSAANNRSTSAPITFPPGPSTAFFDTSVDNVSLSSSEGTYFDLDGGAPDAGGISVDSATEMQSSSLSIDYFDCDEPDDAHLMNSTALSNTSVVEQPAAATANILAARREFDSSDSGSESLPASQSTSLSTSSTTITGNDDDTISSSVLDDTMQKQTLLELCLLSEQQYTNCAAADEPRATVEPISNIAEHLHQSAAEIQHVNSDEDTTTLSSPESDEPLAADPVLENVMENRDDEEAADADEAEMVVNDDDGNNAEAGNSSCNEEADNDSRPQRLRRCSSLKTGKTPPGTPGRKKFVRFADVLGLDLADVKTFMDEIPTVPRSAYDYLTLSTSDAAGAADLDVTAQVPVYTPSFLLDKMLTPMFQQPGGMTGFLERVRLQNVCLENAAITDPICLTISGTVRVRNLDFHKSVHLRYTLDDWLSYADFQATYVEQSCDGFSDKFTFTIFGNSMRIGQRLEMAVRFSCKGEQFWDSNYGVNYCFQCVPAGPVASQATSGSATMVPAMDAVATAAVNEADMLFY